MTSIKLTDACLRAGIWQAVLRSEASVDVPPTLQVSHMGQPVQGLTVDEDPNQPSTYLLRLPVPAQLLNDGVQSFVVSDSATGDVLETFSIVSGHPLDQDLRAEMDLLRAELDILKQAFRRHCSEGG